jgi:hypothetical protein
VRFFDQLSNCQLTVWRPITFNRFRSIDVTEVSEGGGVYSGVCGKTGCAVQQGVRYSRVCVKEGCAVQQDVRYSRMCVTAGCAVQQGVRYSRVYGTAGCAVQQDVRHSRMCGTAGCAAERSAEHVMPGCKQKTLPNLGNTTHCHSVPAPKPRMRYVIR